MMSQNKFSKGTKMAKHNKKRNVGLIHEQLVRFASEKIVEGAKNKAEVALEVLNQHFNQDSQLYKEFRLFNALVHTHASSTDIARRIIVESKVACKNHNSTQLRTEKSSLIRSVNHRLNDCGFYDKRINEYRIFATVQALLNEWRGANRLSPDEIVLYETTLENWLVRPQSGETLEQSKKADPLALKIMIEKFNKKYSRRLNKDQSALLEHALSGNTASTKNKIEEMKVAAQKNLAKFYNSCDNRVLLEKRSMLESKISSLNVDCEDSTIKKALMLSKLVEELEENNE
jgi:hypothetical protein